MVYRKGGTIFNLFDVIHILPSILASLSGSPSTATDVLKKDSLIKTYGMMWHNYCSILTWKTIFRLEQDQTGDFAMLLGIFISSPTSWLNLIIHYSPWLIFYLYLVPKVRTSFIWSKVTSPLFMIFRHFVFNFEVLN